MVAWGGQELTGKSHKGANFWDDGNVLQLVLGGGYMAYTMIKTHWTEHFKICGILLNVNYVTPGKK